MTTRTPAHGRVVLPGRFGIVVAAFGMTAIVATYWDEAFHTDVGRDSGWSPPHLLLYGSVAVVGLVVAGWALVSLNAVRSLDPRRHSLGLVAATLGALGALAAAPIDAFWHEAYGRDAVLWSPPHVLVVFAGTSLALGVLADLPRHAVVARVLVGVVVVANLTSLVFEYETDVPQFSELLYLPVLLAVECALVWTIARGVPVRHAFLYVTAAYVGLRLLVMLTLAGLDRSVPDPPLTIIGLAAAELGSTWAARTAAAATATTVLAVAASWTDLASPRTGDVVAAGATIILTITGVTILRRWRGHHVAAAATILTLGFGLPIANIPPDRAEAHDPGQGPQVSTLFLSATSDAHGSIIVTARGATTCPAAVEATLVARRAGTTRSSPMTTGPDCTFSGTVEVPPDGRWFTYVELVDAHGAALEAWLPVDASKDERIASTRSLYRSTNSELSVSPDQAAAGAFLYILGSALLVLGLVAVQRSCRAVADGA